MDSIKPAISPTIVAAYSTKLAWDALHATYENQSQTWVFSLHDNLACVTKVSRSITDYLHTIWYLLDELTSVAAVVSNP